MLLSYRAEPRPDAYRNQTAAHSCSAKADLQRGYHMKGSFTPINELPKDWDTVSHMHGAL